MQRRIWPVTAFSCIAFLATLSSANPHLVYGQESTTKTWTPRRINKAIELLEDRQPVYYINGYGGYNEGKALAKTWADYILVDLEQNPLDITKMREFMQGLVDGGPTPSGHRTPAVICTLPVLGLDRETVRSGFWVAQQVLGCGVHGLYLCHARSPDAVRAFIQAVRYPIHKQAIQELGEGLRGAGSQLYASTIWGVDPVEYFRIADVWPLNPKGELMIGLRIEDRQALANAEASIKVPGVCFAEWGPRDMGLSYGLLGGQADPPFPKVLQDAGDRVLAACKASKVFFLDNVLPENVEKRIGEGVMIGAGRIQESAEKGRRYTKRKMPW
jgi:4-hydroxy-2-oxoheptanedioate aldolase